VIYPNAFEQKLNFGRIRRLLAELCLSPLGEERVEAMGFSTHFEEVLCWL